MEYANLGLEIAEKIKDPRIEQTSLINLAAAYLGLGNYAKVIDYSEQSLIVARRLKDPQAQATALGNLSSAYIVTGNTIERSPIAAKA